MRTGRGIVVGVAATLALAAAGCVPKAPPPGGPSGCGKAATPVVAQQRHLLSGGVVRSFLLTIPDGYKPHVRTPLILDFHGHGSNAAQQSVYTQLDAKAKSRGFIVATPDGIDNQFDFVEPSDDFTFTQDLVRYLDSILCVSTTRRFSTGMSNGGAMSGAVACLPELDLKAVAGVTAMLPACANGTTMPVLYFHGNADPIVNYAVAGPVIASWAARDGCDATPVETRIEPDIQVRTFVHCDHGLSATLYTIEGGGHTWPDGIVDLPQFGGTTRTIDATDIILDFFAAQ
jgi:polyhydroxybutyrate depolymerase